ncbi:hypothetical protein [Flagellimonas nanhaiensis]|uniref:Uncharacterized protein n=1 Tax=Flagellimonas nanhaiensis TaxID=2292706 RepID=A0A371JL94_9FLAO|nr:hypothetical protein [Allomuricauda nanhaiensis]RDY57699.1 hypothetical protein DX873_17515 [Allomuricauda nanhaiensis]
MALLLTLLPQFDNAGNYSNDVLQMEHDEVFFEQLIELEQKEGNEVTIPFQSFMGNGGATMKYMHGETLKSDYGDNLKYVSAIKLKLLMSNYQPFSWHNRAVRAFVLQLPDDLKIWLYWH